ncbi:TATA box-binding protein-associated factor RNA polymerase I subunit A isoform X2 [Falco rusticolus]|uniref:TATA box-binding protein-associated factor RNA polymerase I subunit A isoform X2 n=1 Tax=Falco rusticolus TaxID=120794 RepID=UPI0018866767|nr:TATA box-binding protein-associated factor RNA polymerase I subunit A isoform X2 [Falco rusticolus]
MDSLLEEEEEEEEEVAARSPAAQARRALLPGLHLPFLPPQFFRPASSHEHKLNFKKSKEVCLNYIQDAILQKQWKRAAEFMTSYVESLEKDYSREYVGPSEIIWRIGTEILCHHSHSSMKEFNSFIEQMKTLGVKRYLKVCLEHAFHLLCNGLTDEAYQNLCLAESWRFGEQTVIQDKEIKLIQAYRGLLDYYSWSKQKSIVLEHGQDGFEDLSVEQEMHGCFRKAAVNLKEIIEIPGVWDQFVKCYVDLLEFYGDHNEARQVLNEYAYNSKFPANPNAHVYLYQFLKRHGESKKSLISALKILYDIVPSHELMIDFNIMLQKSSKKKKKASFGARSHFFSLGLRWLEGKCKSVELFGKTGETNCDIASTLNMYHTKAAKLRWRGFVS